jgi:multidrug resistance efflux pump
VAPSDGVILKIRRQIGETLGSDPVVLMADVSQMYVVCDVFEGDVRRIKEGMQASASAKSLAEPLRGVVDRVGRIIDTTRKLAEVIIRLDDAQAAERLIGMEVQVTIHTEGGR